MWNVISYQQQLADVTCEMDQSPGALSGWWFGTLILWLSIHWEFHDPNWRSPSFFRGVGQPPTSCSSHQDASPDGSLSPKLERIVGWFTRSPPPGFDEALPRSGWNWYSIILEEPLDFSRWIFLIGMNFGWSGWVVAPSLVIYIHLLFWLLFSQLFWTVTSQPWV